MINSTDFRTGLTIEIDGNVWQIVDFQHVKPGKGAAFVRTKIKNVETGAVVDLKGSIPYGDSIFSASFRVRNNINPASQSVQLRVQPCNVDVPLGENTTIYADPYVAVKTDYATGQTTPSVGCFAGVKQKIGDNVVGFVEGQVYDPTNINLETVSVNVGISYSF